jgi:hypothetical protein
LPFPFPDPTRKEIEKPIPTTAKFDAVNHPWGVKAENGAWMIIVRSYSGPDSRARAERLTKEIREQHKCAAYVYSRNGEELKRERDQIEAIRKAEAAKNEPFLKAIEEAKAKAQREGSEFLPSTVKIKVPKPYHESPEQWAVLIGGFADSKAARDALDVVRKFPPPKDTSLMDPVVVQQKNDKGFSSEGTYLNPFSGAMVVPNPAVTRQVNEEKYKLEPFLVKLNSDVKYSLLNAKKPWTLQVKAFTVPMKIVDRESSETVFDRAMRTFTGKRSFLEITAEQAETLADALRHPEMKPHPFPSMVLHHRTGSLVCVGEFNGPDDPELFKMQDELRSMTFKVKRKDTGVEEIQKMFDGVTAMPVPKY